MSKNLLLGYGETLVKPINRPNRVPDKKHPYEYGFVRNILLENLDSFIKETDKLPAKATPNGLRVTQIILHPAYLAKSYYPKALFNTFNLKNIGSKEVYLKPRKYTNSAETGLELPAPCLYVAGRREDFKSIINHLEENIVISSLESEFIKIEDLKSYSSIEKIKKSSSNSKYYEVVLHTIENIENEKQLFLDFAESCKIEIDLNQSILDRGLSFFSARGDENAFQELANYSLLRALRKMPELRTFNPIIRSIALKSKSITIPSEPPTYPDLKVAVFDGGTGNTKIAPWCNEKIYDSNILTEDKYLIHGGAVTSTILFGNTEPVLNIKLPQALCNIDHYRVIDKSNESEVNLIGVLKRILDELNSNKYEFINLSLGPNIPIEDDDVNAWTSNLEKYLCNGETLATIAVGNDGHLADSRIQPPSDLVNGIAVGASNSQTQDWAPAFYSCKGPGRTPGRVKPDGLAFGGSNEFPFYVYSPLNDSITETAGTSFSSPLVLRTAIELKGAITFDLAPITIKALLIHTAIDNKKYTQDEIGWGLFRKEISEIVFCNEDEATIIYQGSLNPSQYVKIPIPFPEVSDINDKVTIKATFCFNSGVDPEHPLNYTRDGLDISFKANEDKERGKPMSFFSRSNYESEYTLRREFFKWENTLRHEKNFKKDTLKNPFFQVVYQARDKGAPPNPKDLKSLPYALIVTTKVKNMTELYNKIRQKYQTLTPIQLKQTIQLPV